MRNFFDGSRSRALQFIRYVAMSCAMYVGVSALLFCAISLLSLPAIESYVVIYFFAYLVDYVTNLRFIFVTNQTTWMPARYLLHVGLFYLASIYFFRLLLSAEINYMAATWVVVILMFPARFFSYKYFVYKRWDCGAYSGVK
jgi:hypothetical protein